MSVLTIEHNDHKRQTDTLPGSGDTLVAASGIVPQYQVKHAHLPPLTTVTEQKKPIPQSGHGLVSDEWARLDIKLGRHDNKKLYKELKRWLGTPYVYAEHTCGEGTDCSGMVMEVFLTVYGIKVHRNSAKMLEENCRVIDLDDLKEGDLVFFCTNGDGRVSHVGIYLKDNKFVHASSSRGVAVDDLRQNYYATHFHAAARVTTKPK